MPRLVRSFRPSALAMGVAIAVAASATSAAAPAGPVLPIAPPVDRAIRDVARARWPETYAAMRALWRTWDQGDPAHVEEAFAALETKPDLRPAERAYAALLRAYARRRRGDLDGARARIRSLGYVDRWLVVGPFDNEGKAGLDTVYGPERDISEPVDLARAFEGKERPVRWRPVPDVHALGWIDVGALVRPQESVCAYATTFVRARPAAAADGGAARAAGAEAAARPATLWVGATGAFALWWNAAPVLADRAVRRLDPDRLAATVRLAPGWNRLVAKVCGDEEAPMLMVRVAGPQGAPDPSIETSNDPAIARQVAPAVAAPAVGPAAGGKREAPIPKPASGAPGPAGAVEGPLQALSRAANAKGAKPDALEAYARYLAATGGDDPAEHVARDMATRAATAAPTTARALLAADLAADRNGRREWIARAREAAGADVPVDVQIAEARLARSGPNWRDATPIYDRVLAADPDEVGAILGRVDLYEEAGLRRSAVALIERALERNPRSVALLRELATQLRQLGRTTEADETEERYAAFRFDDASYLVGRVELAVARRDAEVATRWIERLLAAEPGSAFALATAARSWRALGQTQRAVAAWTRALELAPDDVDTIRALADLHGETGRRDEQIRLLRHILAIRPQAKEVREYVEHVLPPRPRADEADAWGPEKFLPMRDRPGEGQAQRRLRVFQATTVWANGLSSRFHQVVFQPLTDEAAAAAREYAFPYQADTEVVQLRAARVYRASGKIDEAVETGDAPADDPAIAMYTSVRTFWIHLPRLGAGDVVELRWRVEDVTPRNELADSFGEVISLQSSQPTLSAEYVVRAPKGRPIEARSSSGVARAEADEGDARVWRFSARDVAPVAAEPAMPPWAEVLGARVHVSTYRTWDEVARFFWGLARDQLAPDDEVRRRTAEVTAGLSDPREKARAVYDYVARRTRYVALEFGIYGYKPRPCAQTLSRGWGDCKDKATLVVAMLAQAGIPASLVLVRSGLRGEADPDPPSLATFDHAIAHVPSLDLWLDGTAEWSGSGELPPLDRGALALVVAEGGTGRIVHLPDPPPEASRRTRRIDATLGADGRATIDVQLEATGAFAAPWRERYHAKATARDRLQQDLAQALPGFEMAPGAPETGDLEDIERPPRIHVRGRVPLLGRRGGADVSVPIGPAERLVPRFAPSSSRSLDVRVGFRSTLDDEIVVRLPAGVEAKSTPEAVHEETPFGAFSVALEPGKGTVTVRTKLSLARSRVAASDYAAWRAFCEAADRAFGQSLVVGPRR